MKSQEFMKIKKDLVEKLTISELESMILSLQRTLRKQAREAQKEAAKKIMEEQMRLIRISDKKKREAQCKKIMEEQMRLKGLSEVKEIIKHREAQGEEYWKTCEEQTYSSEYNDTEDWIDFFIEKQSNMYYDNEKEVLEHFEEYVPHDF